MGSAHPRLCKNRKVSGMDEASGKVGHGIQEGSTQITVKPSILCFREIVIG